MKATVIRQNEKRRATEMIEEHGKNGKLTAVSKIIQLRVPKYNKILGSKILFRHN